MPTIVNNDVHDQVWTRIKGVISITERNLRSMAKRFEDVYGIGTVRLNGKFIKTVGNIYGKNLLGEKSSGNLGLYVFRDVLEVVDFDAKEKVSMYDLFERHPNHGTMLFWKVTDQYPNPLDLIKANIRDLSDNDDSRHWKVENWVDGVLQPVKSSPV